MTFLDHLDELRRRIFASGLALIIGFAICYPFSKSMFGILARPINQYLAPGEALAYTTLTEPFFVYLKVAALGAVFLTSPFVLFQVWLFVAPGLYRREKIYAIPFVLASTACFLLGAAFAFKLLFPSICRFFLGVGEGYKMVVTLDQYFSLLFWTVLGVALTFELPVLSGLLALLGVVRSRWLAQNFHIAVVACLVVAAVITPTPDALTMLFVAVPMVALYAVGVLVAWVLEPREKEQGRP